MVNLRLLEKIVFMPDSKLVPTEMTTTYHLNRAGELLGIAMSGKMAAGKFVEGRPDKTDSIQGEATFHATVVGDQLHWTGQVSFRDFGTVGPELDPSPAPKGVFLNPMHPIRACTVCVRAASGRCKSSIRLPTLSVPFYRRSNRNSFPPANRLR